MGEASESEDEGPPPVLQLGKVKTIFYYFDFRIFVIYNFVFPDHQEPVKPDRLSVSSDKSSDAIPKHNTLLHKKLRKSLFC
jgi:hypothetical protein